MDAGAHHGTAPVHGTERRWNQLAGRGKDNRGVKRLRWRTQRIARPCGAQLKGEALCHVVATANKGINATTLKQGYLCDNVRRCA
jgi:hypothetical protein